MQPVRRLVGRGGAGGGDPRGPPRRATCALGPAGVPRTPGGLSFSFGEVSFVRFPRRGSGSPGWWRPQLQAASRAAAVSAEELSRSASASPRGRCELANSAARH